MSDFSHLDYWKAITLYGLNVATYKPALAKVLIKASSEGLSEIKWDDLSKRFFLEYKARFANTPSTWPTYGRILSRYGRRRHPLTRKWHYHKGIDIPSWNGAPIKATADGIVIYAGWANTFGNLVTIRHGMGYMTLYAHASRVLVKKGESVKKGQIIAQIGSSGLSTGPHIHYEINRWGKSVNPISYLDLDMFTASRKMW